MDSAFPLITEKHQHDPRWKAALEKAPNLCPGKDVYDTRCTCPDVIYATRVRLIDGLTISHELYCGCCGLEIIDTTHSRYRALPTP